MAIQGHLTLITGLFYSKGAASLAPRFGVQWAEGPLDPSRRHSGLRPLCLEHRPMGLRPISLCRDCPKGQSLYNLRPMGRRPIGLITTTDWPTASPSTHFRVLFYCTIEAMGLRPMAGMAHGPCSRTPVALWATGVRYKGSMGLRPIDPVSRLF